MRQIKKLIVRRNANQPPLEKSKSVIIRRKMDPKVEKASHTVRKRIIGNPTSADIFIDINKIGNKVLSESKDKNAQLEALKVIKTYEQNNKLQELTKDLNDSDKAIFDNLKNSNILNQYTLDKLAENNNNIDNQTRMNMAGMQYIYQKLIELGYRLPQPYQQQDNGGAAAIEGSNYPQLNPVPEDEPDFKELLQQKMDEEDAKNEAEQEIQNIVEQITDMTSQARATIALVKKHGLVTFRENLNELQIYKGLKLLQTGKITPEKVKAVFVPNTGKNKNQIITQYIPDKKETNSYPSLNPGSVDLYVRSQNGKNPKGYYITLLNTYVNIDDYSNFLKDPIYYPIFKGDIDNTILWTWSR